MRGQVARVLIVDDEQADRIILGDFLEQAGHQVDFASDGEETLGIYLRWSFDVVVTDLHMPDGQGLEFIKALLAMLPETVIIAVSGKGTDLLAEAESEGVLAALTKPLTPTNSSKPSHGVPG